MSRRTLADWQTINDEFEASRLSVTDFCRDREFSPKYFYAVRSKLKRQSSTKSRFVKAQPMEQKLESLSNPSSIQFQCAGGTLTFPTSVSPTWVAELIRALA